ncbi:hypothetical protein M885DRAFT_513051 [Pelagophyceae sp. CCMP2097]|nr:hypothetical protein M885DRAFT_513051 [Pelagophyceae sp. CCMP2097]|mmetsp:Transcript_25325/g.86862  ORF Transcript_25325/g.86862 Transcript_25325/m.86862 type:complete len:320 (+) Transcript_25325:46-1005(+)
MPPKRRAARAAEADAGTALAGAFEVLPTELVVYVLRFCSLRSIRGAAARACKRLRALGMSSAVFGGAVDVAWFQSGHVINVTALLDLMARLNVDGLVRSLKLGNHKWGKRTTTRLLQLFPRMEDVDFGTSKKVAVHDFADLSAANAPQLKALAWGWMYGVPERALTSNIIHGRHLLQHLKLANWEGNGDGHGFLGTDATLVGLGAHCPNLRCLDLKGALSFTDAGFGALVSGTRACLESCTLMTKMIFNPTPWMPPALHQLHYNRLTLDGVHRHLLDDETREPTCPKLRLLVLAMPAPNLNLRAFDCPSYFAALRNRSR